jgi:predicted GNAT family N-acyltransferase
MNAERAFAVRACRWADAASPLRQVRHAVFVVEQRVPETLEWDDADAQSLHALAVEASGGAIGCARLLPDGHIGRVAVLVRWRRRGVGSALLLRLVDETRSRGDARVILNAQVAAMPFYARHGFVARGDAFDEAGIAHRVMERPLSTGPAFSDSTL